MCYICDIEFPHSVVDSAVESDCPYCGTEDSTVWAARTSKKGIRTYNFRCRQCGANGFVRNPRTMRGTLGFWQSPTGQICTRAIAHYTKAHPQAPTARDGCMCMNCGRDTAQVVACENKPVWWMVTCTWCLTRTFVKRARVGPATAAWCLFSDADRHVIAAQIAAHAHE